MRPQTSDERIKALERRVQALEDSLRKRGDGIPLYDRSVDIDPLIAARKAVGWSQVDLARGLGVSRAMVGLWEVRRVKLPTWRARQIVDLFEKYGATPPAFEFSGEE